MQERTSKRKTREKSQRGSTLVEFSIAGTVFFIALFGALEVSRLLWTYNALADAVRTGARYASLHEANQETAVENVVVYGTDNPGEGAKPVVTGLNDGHVTVTYSNDFGVKRGSVRVRLSNYSFSFIVPLFGASLTLPPYEVVITGESAGVAPTPIT